MCKHPNVHKVNKNLYKKYHLLCLWDCYLCSTLIAIHATTNLFGHTLYIIISDPGLLTLRHLLAVHPHSTVVDPPIC